MTSWEPGKMSFPDGLPPNESVDGPTQTKNDNMNFHVLGDIFGGSYSATNKKPTTTKATTTTTTTKTTKAPKPTKPPKASRPPRTKKPKKSKKGKSGRNKKSWKFRVENQDLRLSYQPYSKQKYSKLSALVHILQLKYIFLKCCISLNKSAKAF